MKLDLTSLRKSVASLDRALVRTKKEPQDEELRDAVIQRFAYTYEICWKMIKRQVEQESANPASVDQLAFRDLIRDAAERGIVKEVEPWFEYRDQRNITSHTYNEDEARSVYATAVRFAEDARALLAELERRNA